LIPFFFFSFSRF